MNIINFLLIGISTAFLITFVIIHLQIKKLFIMISGITHQLKENEEEFVKSKLSTYEIERLEREDKFNKRILDLKHEINVKNDLIRRGVPAEELHPLVHNLPHNVVNDYQRDNDVEIAD